MSLYIEHCKATMKKPKAADLFYIEDAYSRAKIKSNFNDFNVPFEHFEKYIHQIDCPKYIDEIIIVKKVNFLIAQNHFCGGGRLSSYFDKR